MGEYADMAIEEGLDQSWGWRRRRYGPRTVVCNRCGQPDLLWSSDPPYHLEEYVWREDTRTGKYERHSCKFKGFRKNAA